MAEAVGFAASVITLSSLVAQIAKTTKQISNAPKEIQDVSRELVQLSLQLEGLHDLQRASYRGTLAQQSSWTSAHCRSVKEAERTLRQVYSELQRLARKSQGARGQLRWIFVGQEEAETLYRDLDRTRVTLLLTIDISICSLRVAHHAEHMGSTEKMMRLLEDISSMQHQRLGNLSGHVPMMVHHSPFPSAAHHQSPNLACFDREIRSANAALYRGPLFYGWLLSALTAINHNHLFTDYNWSLLLRLPWSRALKVDLFLQLSCHSWSSFRVLKDSSLAFVKLVEESSSFLCACKSGNIAVMQYMLERNEASPHESTSKNVTPMMCAIQSGVPEAVQMLLDRGVDVNGLFGQRQTSPLALAVRLRQTKMVRLLINSGACCQHLTSFGWTPLFYLWSTRAALDCSIPDELVQILASRPDFALSHAGITDVVGYPVIHLVVIRGTAKDLGVMIELGVDLFATEGPLRWTSIHQAVYYGRVDQMEVLLPHYKHLDVDTPDGQGWTLLHIAAFQGHGAIIERLLQLGASQQALTSAHFSHLPRLPVTTDQSLEGNCFTPLELATARNVEYRKIFLDSVATAAQIAALNITECLVIA